METKGTSAPTHFAPAERLSVEEVHLQSAAVSRELEVFSPFEAVSELILILNQERQVVYANRKCLALLGEKGPEDILGRRPGEVFGCLRAGEGPGGCGTSRFCRECGAVRAILSSQQGKPDEQECRMMRDHLQGALDLLVKTTQLLVEETEYTVVSITDLSDQKRRQLLERVFFHDVLNTAGGIQGLASVLLDIRDEDPRSYLEMLEESSNQLVEEIRHHRQLIQAENGSLQPYPTRIFLPELYKKLTHTYENHPVAVGKRIEVEEIPPVEMFTDGTLLVRILSNLLKNALEATQYMREVRLSAEVEEGDRVSLYVHNPGVIEESVQRQLFQRSFSTKGEGRGIGTYSIRLFTEKYLRGIVDFISTAEDGTCFRVTLPRTLAAS